MNKLSLNSLKLTSCILKVGRSVSIRAFMLEINESQWVEKSSMSHGRQSPACGQIENAVTGKEEVIVAGGGGSSGFLQSVEIYTVTDDNWRAGTPLPHKIGYPSYVPLEDSFVIIGGRSHSTHSLAALDTIYMVK